MASNTDQELFDMHQTTDLTSEYPQIDELPENERHDLLASDRRRTVLEVLAEQTGETSLRALAVAVTMHETDGGMTEEGAAERMAISLHHHHLPRLAESGVIEYDPNARRIE